MTTALPSGGDCEQSGNCMQPDPTDLTPESAERREREAWFLERRKREAWFLNLTHLILDDDFDLGRLRKDAWPPTLTHLTVAGEYNEPLNLGGDWLPNVTHLTLLGEYNRPIVFPPNLTHLKFGEQSDYNQPVSKWPLRLEMLTICTGAAFKNPLINLPAALVRVEVPWYGQRPCDDIPNTAQYMIYRQCLTWQKHKRPRSIFEALEDSDPEEFWKQWILRA